MSVPAPLVSNDGAAAVAEARVPLVDAATLAAELGCSRKWIYEHADELGALALGALGDGKRPRLRFDPVAARAALACLSSKRSQASTPSVDGAAEAIALRRRRRLPNRLPAAGSILRSRPRAQA